MENFVFDRKLDWLPTLFPSIIEHIRLDEGIIWINEKQRPEITQEEINRYFVYFFQVVKNFGEKFYSLSNDKMIEYKNRLLTQSLNKAAEFNEIENLRQQIERYLQQLEGLYLKQE